MRPPDVKLQAIHRGDPRTIFVTVTDTLGSPIDLSGSTWTCVVRKFLTATEGIPLTVDPANLAVGVIKLTLSGEQSRGLGRQLVGDLEGTAFGTILSFSGVVYSDVTRSYTPPVGGLIDNFTLTWGGVELSAVSETIQAILIAGAAGPQLSFIQAIPSYVWTINHAFGFKPNIETFDTPGDQIEGDVFHVNSSQCTITFSYPTTGTAVLS